MDNEDSVPFVSHLQTENGKPTIAQAMFKVSDDDKLIMDNALDSKGQLRLYDPTVQECLLEAIRSPLLKRLKDQEKDKEEKKKECKRIENVAKVARKLAESD